MFSYFGSKICLVNKYPPPKFDRIIEPFAGSAAYSLQYYLREVILIELNPVVYGIWNFIINEATVDWAKQLPELEQGDDLRDIKHLTKIEKNLLGFAVSCGSAAPSNIQTKRSSAIEKIVSRRKSRIELLKRRLQFYIPRIKHWKVLNISYSQYKCNEPSTWFIDPPYMKAGNAYPFHNIDYKLLANYCKSRQGQIIVCGGMDCNYLPFEDLDTKNLQGSIRAIKEKVWLKNA